MSFYSSFLPLYFLEIQPTPDSPEDCSSIGAHYNPYDKDHANPSEEPNDWNRHIGALGNIYSYEGFALYEDYCSTAIKLRGPESIIGKGFGVHADRD